MSSHVGQFHLPREMILMVSEYLSNQDYVAFKSSSKEIYFALNDSKRETIGKKNTMKLCIRANLSADESIPDALYNKTLRSLTLFELELLDKAVTTIVSNNFESLKLEEGVAWKKPAQISNLTDCLASLGEKEILESLLRADTEHQIEEPCIGNAFYKAASLGHQSVVTFLLSNPSGRTFHSYFLEKGLIFSSLNKHSGVVKEILEAPRIEQIRDFAFSRAFSLSTVSIGETSSASQGFTNSFLLFLKSDKIRAVKVNVLYDSISNLLKLGHEQSAEALLRSKRVKSQTFSAILSIAISSMNLEVFTYLMKCPKNSLLSFSGFKKALSTSCKVSATAPYFFLAEHQYFKSLSKNDLQSLLDVFGKLSLKKQKEDDTVAIRRSVFETFSKKVKN